MKRELSTPNHAELLQRVCLQILSIALGLVGHPCTGVLQAAQSETACTHCSAFSVICLSFSTTVSGWATLL